MRGTRSVPFWVVLGVIGAVLTTACGPGPGAAPAGDVAAATSGTSLQLVVVGDSIPSAGTCPGCTGFVEQYADHLAAATGREVTVTDRSRDDAAGITEIRAQVLGEERLREQLAAADVVIVSAGSNDVMPDASAIWGCDDDMGETTKDYIRWALDTTATCREDARMVYAADFDTILATINELRAQAPTKAIALNAYDANLHGADILAANLSKKTLQTLWPWMTQLYDDWNRMLCAKATTRFFDCVDLYHAFNGPAGDQPVGDLTVDGRHPSQAGHDRIAELLATLDLTVLQTD